MPKKSNIVLDVSDELGYDSDEYSDHEDDLNDIDLMNEKLPNVNNVIQTFAQILIISHMIGQKQFTLSRYGTKKFLDKVRQFQELSQIDKMDDINYGSRMGKSAEILCKLAALAQILNVCVKILKWDWLSDTRNHTWTYHFDIYVQNVSNTISNINQRCWA